MKKTLIRIMTATVLSILTVLFVCSCTAEDKSIGIIGGADGPTAIFAATPGGVANTDNGGDIIGGADTPTFMFRLLARGVLQFFDGSTAYIAAVIALYILTALVAYALGSLNFGIIISKLIYKDDIRKYGSGNAGTTNMLRTYGNGAAIATILGDALKVVFAIIISYLLVGRIMGGGYVAGLFAIIGHVYPVYYGFKGGKGVVTSAITILMLDPSVFLVVFTVFVVVVAIWRYISLGSILSAAVYPLVTYAAANGKPSLDVLFAFLIAVFVIFLHRTNIQRLIDGKENKLSFKKSGKKSVPTDTDSENK